MLVLLQVHVAEGQPNVVQTQVRAGPDGGEREGQVEDGARVFLYENFLPKHFLTMKKVMEMVPPAKRHISGSVFSSGHQLCVRAWSWAPV